MVLRCKRGILRIGGPRADLARRGERHPGRLVVGEGVSRVEPALAGEQALAEEDFHLARVEADRAVNLAVRV
jgi:hypothetical protein